MDSNFPFNLSKGYFTDLLKENNITTERLLKEWLFNLPLDSDANDTTELALLEHQQASNTAKNAFFARISIENEVAENRFFVGFPIINARMVPELEKELSDLPNQALPIVLGYLKCGDRRLTIGNDQAIIDLLGKYIIREHHVDPHQGFEWRQMMYDDYLTRYIERNKLPQTLEDLKKIKEKYFQLYLK